MVKPKSTFLALCLAGVTLANAAVAEEAPQAGAESTPSAAAESATPIESASTPDVDAVGSPPEPAARRGFVSPARRVLHTAVAAGPGAIVHGLGHTSVGQARVGKRLLVAEGVGLGAMVGGLGGLALTGASRYVVAPLSLVTIAGAGLVATSWLADVYGTALREDERGHPATLPATFETELGYRHVYDPQFRYRNFVAERLDGRFWRLHLAASVWQALDDSNARMSALAGLRLGGPTPGRAGRDGSFADVETAVTRHAFGSDGFEARSAELALSARLDLARWEALLDGSFVEGGAGVALRETSYDVPGASIDPDYDTLLLARFGFGFYYGDPNRRGGETSVYYDHRHDDFAAGLQVTGLGSGVAGHFGTTTRLWLGDTLGVMLEGQVGSAWVAGLSLMARARTSEEKKR